MEIVYKTQSGIVYKLIYTTTKKMIYSKKIGKISTIITQCLVYRDELVIGFSQAQKCQCDIDSPKFAHLLVTNKIMHLIQSKKSKANIIAILRTKLFDNDGQQT